MSLIEYTKRKKINAYNSFKIFNLEFKLRIYINIVLSSNAIVSFFRRDFDLVFD